MTSDLHSRVAAFAASTLHQPRHTERNGTPNGGVKKNSAEPPPQRAEVRQKID
jgi:hypothetical protein